MLLILLLPFSCLRPLSSFHWLHAPFCTRGYFGQFHGGFFCQNLRPTRSSTTKQKNKRRLSFCHVQWRKLSRVHKEHTDFSSSLSFPDMCSQKRTPYLCWGLTQPIPGSLASALCSLRAPGWPEPPTTSPATKFPGSGLPTGPHRSPTAVALRVSLRCSTPPRGLQQPALILARPGAAPPPPSGGRGGLLLASRCLLGPAEKVGAPF